MTVIHCHDDKQYVILDQYLFLKHIYTGTEDWRRSTLLERRRNLTWRRELFYVEQPFRAHNAAQKKNKKKKNAV